MIDKTRHLPLFVYGTLMSGQPAFHLLAPAVVRSARAVVEGLVMHDAGAYPVAVHGEGQIWGEVHWLGETRYVSLLDTLAAYEGPLYRRKRCVAHLESAEGLVEAWVFIGVRDFGSRLPFVTGGDWRQWLQHQRNK